MLRQAIVAAGIDVVLLKHFGKALDDKSIRVVLNQLEESRPADGYGIDVRNWDFFNYRITFASHDPTRTCFVLVTDLNDDEAEVKKQVALFRKEFLDLFGDKLGTRIDPSMLSIFDPNLEYYHRQLKPKIALCGYSGVGKTTINRLIRAEEIPVEHVPTITGEIGVIKIGKLHFNIWDFAGQESFLKLWTKFIKGSDAVLIVTDSTPENVERSKYFVSLAAEQASNAKVAVIANKQDLAGAMPAEQVGKILGGSKSYGIVANDPQNRDKMINIIADVLEMNAEISPLLKPLIDRDKKMDEAQKALEDGDFLLAKQLFTEISELCLQLGDDKIANELYMRAEKMGAIIASMTPAELELYAPARPGPAPPGETPPTGTRAAPAAPEAASASGVADEAVPPPAHPGPVPTERGAGLLPSPSASPVAESDQGAGHDARPAAAPSKESPLPALIVKPVPLPGVGTSLPAALGVAVHEQPAHRVPGTAVPSGVMKPPSGLPVTGFLKPPPAVVSSGSSPIKPPVPARVSPSIVAPERAVAVQEPAAAVQEPAAAVQEPAVPSPAPATPAPAAPPTMPVTTHEPGAGGDKADEKPITLVCPTCHAFHNVRVPNAAIKSITGLDASSAIISIPCGPTIEIFFDHGKAVLDIRPVEVVAVKYVVPEAAVPEKAPPAQTATPADGPGTTGQAIATGSAGVDLSPDEMRRQIQLRIQKIETHLMDLEISFLNEKLPEKQYKALAGKLLSIKDQLVKQLDGVTA
ncbi:MAG: GTP-binding protein [Candidatus Lokiarchaeota archaeon]|nr:GTP-binding protein [Candidatus Lokiarchaeota archaeon]